jgi:hypothetical protein
MAKLCAKGKAAAKRKFDVYPSAYANMYASAVCSGKVKPGGKKPQKKANGGIIKGCADFSGDARPKMAKGGSVSQQRKTGKIKTPKNISRGCGMVMPNRRKTFKVT